MSRGNPEALGDSPIISPDPARVLHRPELRGPRGRLLGVWFSSPVEGLAVWNVGVLSLEWWVAGAL